MRGDGWWRQYDGYQNRWWLQQLKHVIQDCQSTGVIKSRTHLPSSRPIYIRLSIADQGMNAIPTMVLLQRIILSYVTNPNNVIMSHPQGKIRLSAKENGTTNAYDHDALMVDDYANTVKALN
ncbi:hypothetical protein E3N88_31859 [Mikania micrantha]|uniref:Uncharacterized protein n=1 Tax=Mikania micrantha TaxID=192012 RepID=A0A5N6M6V4_9ASTR|nr:hypothetical protein E3N88_31859 [Mikania micrantha]